MYVFEKDWCAMKRSSSSSMLQTEPYFYTVTRVKAPSSDSELDNYVWMLRSASGSNGDGFIMRNPINDKFLTSSVTFSTNQSDAHVWKFEFLENGTALISTNDGSKIFRLSGSGFQLINKPAANLDAYGITVYKLIEDSETTPTGNGSEASPFTCEDMLSGRAGVSSVDTYVTGYVTGWFGRSSTTYSATAGDDENIVLSDAVGETNFHNAMPACLKEGDNDNRTIYGLHSHPEYLGFKVRMYGTVSHYFRPNMISFAKSVDFLAHHTSVSSYRYATYTSPKAQDFTKTGIYPYTAAVKDGVVVLKRIENGQVPANTPVLLYSESACDADVAVINDAAELEGNELLVSDGETAKGDTIYVLAKKDGQAVFCPWTSETSLSAGRVYIVGPSFTAASRDFLPFAFDETAGIENIEHGTRNIGHSVYDLQGRRAANGQSLKKGLYVNNGKKFIVR